MCHLASALGLVMVLLQHREGFDPTEEYVSVARARPRYAARRRQLAGRQIRQGPGRESSTAVMS